MPHVIRNADGVIVGLSEEVPQEDVAEELPLSHPDVKAFLTGARERLSASDAETVRVVEDIVDILIKKKLILWTDLPPAAQKKLAERRSMRDDLQALGNLMIEEDDIL